MTFQPVPLEPTEATSENAYFRPIPVSGVGGNTPPTPTTVSWDDIEDVPAVLDDIPEPPEDGVFVLTSTDGVLSWDVLSGGESE